MEMWGPDDKWRESGFWAGPLTGEEHDSIPQSGVEAPRGRKRNVPDCVVVGGAAVVVPAVVCCCCLLLLDAVVCCKMILYVVAVRCMLVLCWFVCCMYVPIHLSV